MTTLDAALHARDLRHVRAVAPELLARADAAARRAHAATTREAADDAATEGRLWLGAARAEARRADAEAQTAAMRAATRTSLAGARDLEAQRDAASAQASRLAAAVAARDELARALAQARTDEPRRPRLPSQSEDGSRDAARTIAVRARMLSAAATALGATAEETHPVDEALALEASRLQADPRAALDAADRARRLAENALGAARAREGGAPDAASIAELGESAHTAGLDAVATERGVELRVALFRGAAPDARLVTELAALIAAHPHGPVLVELEALADAASRRTAAQRVASIVAALTRAGIPATRLRAAAGPATPRAATPPAAIVVFLGYAPPALGAAPVPPDAPPPAPAAAPNGADTD